MLRSLGAAVLGLVIFALPVAAQKDARSAKDAKKPVTSDGKAVKGKVKLVDSTAKTLTITDADGKDHTFSVTKDTRFLGPQGGKSTKGLKDDRLAKGYEVTVVPGTDGKTAQEVRLPRRKPKTKDK